MEDVICKVKSWVQVLVQQPFVPLAPLTAVHMCGRDESFTQHHVGRRSAAAAAVCESARECRRARTCTSASTSRGSRVGRSSGSVSPCPKVTTT